MSGSFQFRARMGLGYVQTTQPVRLTDLYHPGKYFKAGCLQVNVDSRKYFPRKMIPSWFQVLFRAKDAELRPMLESRMIHLHIERVSLSDQKKNHWLDFGVSGIPWLQDIAGVKVTNSNTQVRSRCCEVD